MAHEHHTAIEVLDPVCGMAISPEDAVGHVRHEGHTYYFCNQSCLEKFKDNPALYLDTHKENTAPELHHDPVCGMGIEAQDAVGTVEHNGKLHYFCSTSCIEKFKGHPENYLHTKGKLLRLPEATRWNTRVRWIPKFASSDPERARSAAWRLNQLQSLRHGCAASIRAQCIRK